MREGYKEHNSPTVKRDIIYIGEVVKMKFNSRVVIASENSLRIRFSSKFLFWTNLEFCIYKSLSNCFFISSLVQTEYKFIENEAKLFAVIETRALTISIDIVSNRKSCVQSISDFFTEHHFQSDSSLS